MKNCIHCSTTFEVTDADRAFYDKVSPVIAGKKYSIPEPTLCPACRMQRRMAFRNERHLYKRKCDFSGQDIVAIYPPNSSYKIYDQKAWWSDQWDPMSYGREFDFNRPFFKQFHELLLEVPQINLQNRNNENSDYGNDTNDLKNCYLCFNSGPGEDTYYVNTGGYFKNCMDIFWCLNIELCYECSKIQGGYHCFWCFNGQNLSDCYFCDNCRACKNCFGCVGLRQREYCVYNEQLSKEEYKQFIKSFRFTHSEVQKARQKLKELSLRLPHKNLEIHQSEDCVGDHIQNCKNCTECFDIMDSENCKYIWDGMVNNSYDCFNTGINTNFVYECVGVYQSANIYFCVKCSLGSSNLMYCDFCFQSEHLFGCVGLRHKKYCIFNKQYSKEDYFNLKSLIINHMVATGEWGQFFPPALSLSGYNDTLAQEYFPLTREEAIRKGFLWNDYVKPKVVGTKKIPANRLPEDIASVPDDILNWVIECEKDGKLFKLIPQELKFYRDHHLPVPHRCPDCRHYARKAQINPRKLYVRACAKCSAPIQTTYAPDRPEIVYCEACYLKEVY